MPIIPLVPLTGNLGVLGLEDAASINISNDEELMAVWLVLPFKPLFESPLLEDFPVRDIILIEDNSKLLAHYHNVCNLLADTIEGASPSAELVDSRKEFSRFLGEHVYLVARAVFLDGFIVKVLSCH